MIARIRALDDEDRDELRARANRLLTAKKTHDVLSESHGRRDGCSTWWTRCSSGPGWRTGNEFVLDVPTREPGGAKPDPMPVTTSGDVGQARLRTQR